MSNRVPEVGNYPAGGKRFSIAADEAYATIGNTRFYEFTTAITSAVTTTASPAGSIGTTTNATGAGSLFKSNGTVWTAV